MAGARLAALTRSGVRYSATMKRKTYFVFQLNRSDKSEFRAVVAAVIASILEAA